MKRALSTLLLLILVLAIVVSPLASMPQVWAEPGLETRYEYYGYVPARIWGQESLPGDAFHFRVNPNTIADRGLLVFIGNYDQTKVSVYVLPNRSLVEGFTINRLEKVTVSLPNGTFFKAISDRPVTVILMGGRATERSDGWANTFFTSVGGGYVGKEFIFMAVQGRTLPYVTGFPFRVFALEDSQVTVADANGSRVADFSLKANQYKQLTFNPFGVYRLTSTGNVITQSWVGGSVFYPAARGGFAGRLFYGAALVKELWGSLPPPPTFVMTGLEDAKARIIDLEFTKEFSITGVAAHANNSVQIVASHFVLESDKPITLIFQSGGLAYAGVRPGETIEVYVPTGKDALSMGEAYIFAEEGTAITIDDVAIRVSANELLPLQPGIHRVSADRNAVIQVVHWDAYIRSYNARIENPEAGLPDFASCVPSLQAMGLTYEGIQLRPVLGGENPRLYALVAVVSIALVAAWRLRARRKAH